MRRLISPWSVVAASAACLVAFGGPPAARAESAGGPLDQLVAAWMSVVGVIGTTDEAAALDERTFVIDDEGDEARKPDRERRDGERAAGGRRHHRGGPAHGGRPMGGPPMHGPHHPGMGPGHMGPPGGPAEHHPAMRAFHEISRRLGRIEEKLGIESGPPSGPMGGRPAGPPPEMRRRQRGPDAAPGRPRPEMSEEMRRQMKQRMEQGKERMEQARRRVRGDGGADQEARGRGRAAQGGQVVRGGSGLHFAEFLAGAARKLSGC